MGIPGRFYREPWKARVLDEVDEELAFHLEMRTRELVARGIAPDVAARQARRALERNPAMRATLEALATDRDRHMQRTQYLAELQQDVTFTARQFVKNPAFAAIATLTLALGIAGATAIFSALYAVVLQPLPLREPDRLFAVGETYRGLLSSMSAGIYVDAQEGTNAFDGLAALQFANYNLSDSATPERVVGAKVTANYFAVMGTTPLAGRVFTADEDRPGHDRVAVISNRLWRRRFGGAPLVGREIRLNSTPYTVLGIMPPSFDLTNDSEELWTPIAFTPERRRMHDEHYLQVYGRLKPGITRERALAELAPVAERMSREYANELAATGVTFSMRPFAEQFVGDYRPRLFVLMAAVSVVLLIACGNVANLLLARGSARAREIAIRAAIGAGRWRIVRQLLTESVVLGIASAVVGVALAHLMVRAVVAWSPPDIPRLDQAQVDPLALGFAVFAALTSSILCGIAPALRLARHIQGGLNAAHGGRRGTTGGGFRDRIRAGLIVGEVALSILLLTGAGLLIRSALALQRVDPGFDPYGVFTARFTLPEQSYADPVREADMLRRFGQAARLVSGVKAAAVSSYAAMGSGGGTNGLVPEGLEGSDRSKFILSILRVTTSDFFPAMRTPILKGRAFTDDDRENSQRVMIINATLAAKAFPGQDPLGKRISCCEAKADGAWKIVIGVAGDIHSRGPALPPDPEFYLPWTQVPKDAWNWFRTFYIIARTDGDPARLLPPLREAMARIDPDVALFDVRTMDQRLNGTLATARFNTLLLSILGAIGLLLAASGIYGVLSYLVSQRTQEIGVRMALGASQASVVGLILRQSLKPVGLGAAIGLLVTMAATRVLASQLFEVSRTDPLTIATVSTTLIAVALAASAVPARRAASVDPTRALSGE